MTDWKKTYSVWLHTSLIVAGIITAVVEYLQKLDPTTPAIVAVIGAVTIVLRSIPQKPSDGGTPGAGSSLNAFLLPGLLACLLSAPNVACTKQEVAKTVDQIACAAKVEARETLMLYAAGCIDLEYKPTGKCTDAQFDTIMTPFDVEGEACFQN